MERNGFAEQSINQRDFGASITFVGNAAARTERTLQAPAVAEALPELAFRETPSGVSESRIQRLETQLELQLPAEFRAFLLKYNGGELSSAAIETGNAVVKHYRELDALGRNT